MLSSKLQLKDFLSFAVPASTEPPSTEFSTTNIAKKLSFVWFGFWGVGGFGVFHCLVFFLFLVFFLICASRANQNSQPHTNVLWEKVLPSALFECAEQLGLMHRCAC